MNAPYNWLLEGEAWIEYRTRLDLLGQSRDDPEVTEAHRGMLASPQVQSLLNELSAWPGTVISSISAGQPFHKLTFVADLGLRVGDPCIDGIIARIFTHQSEEGPFQLLVNIPVHFWWIRSRPMGMGAL